MGDDGQPVFADTPPTRAGWQITEAEAVEWATLRDVPIDAVMAWYEHPERKSRCTVRDDIDIAQHGLERWRERR